MLTHNTLTTQVLLLKDSWLVMLVSLAGVDIFFLYALF